MKLSISKEREMNNDFDSGKSSITQDALIEERSFLLFRRDWSVHSGSGDAKNAN